MPTSTRWEVTNSPQISVKEVHSARADVGIGPYRVRRKNAEAHTGDSLGRSRAGTQHNPSAASGQMPFGCAGVAFMELRSDYFLQRQRKVTICARVQPASGLKVVAVVPAVMPFW